MSTSRAATATTPSWPAEKAQAAPPGHRGRRTVSRRARRIRTAGLLRRLDRTPVAARQSRPHPSRRAARHFLTCPITPLTADREIGLRLSGSSFAIRQIACRHPGHAILQDSCCLKASRKHQHRSLQAALRRVHVMAPDAMASPLRTQESRCSRFFPATNAAEAAAQAR